MLRGKTGKTFLFSSLDQIVQFGAKTKNGYIILLHIEQTICFAMLNLDPRVPLSQGHYARKLENLVV